MRRFAAAALVLAGPLLAACDEGGSPVVEPEPGVTTSSTAAPGSTEPGEAPQPALWPAADVVLATPEEAAVGFIENVLGAGIPGQFREGDARSGEIDVIFTGEGGGAEIVRSTLLVRRLGEAGGWFVIAATNPNAAITAPTAGSEVPVGEPLHVEGIGRGFEGAVVVKVLRAGVGGQPLVEVPTIGGAQAQPAPFAVDVDLSTATPGETLILLVQGGVGLETDPGDVGAIPIVVR